MPDEPTTGAGYRPEFLERARRTCLHVATVIGDMTDEVVLVGGLVPSLIVAQGSLPSGAERHVGTMDVDVGLALGLLDEGRYQELGLRLRRAGFGPDANEAGRRTRQRWVWKDSRGVSVDFLIPPSTLADRGGTIRDLQEDFAALIAPGLPLAFRDRTKVTLDGETLLWERAVREMWVCGPAAYLVLKALAFRSRGENKDAYDLFYVLRNHGDGPRTAAESFRPLLDDPAARDALVILEADFTAPDSVGAMRAAAFLARQGANRWPRPRRARQARLPDSLDKSNVSHYFARVIPGEVDPMSAVEFVDDLASRGRYHFTTSEAAARLGSSPVAARAALRRLQQKGLVATPRRGFHVVLPPEYRRLGCLPADQFVPQLMEHLGLDYYAALLTAGRYHGAAHQQPQVFQVMVAKNRPPIACGEVRVAFVARRNVADVPTARFNTPRGQIAVSKPEATAFDLVGYAQHAGGIDNVATVLAELAEMLDADVLASLATLSPVPWSQRLGYLLERVGASEKTEPLAHYVAGAVNEATALVPSSPADGATHDARWRLLVNVQPEPDV